ncbi:MAG: sulfite exporter TauE/SafE family protein [Myxococcales bacterium]|nr:sulfite exporter TauE/SafE family protein [Myxococcales bacterium]
MLIVVLALALLIGVTLGLLGGGGSILTLPTLTYVAGVETKAAIAASLFVVAVTSATGVVAHARAGRVRWRTGLVFGAAGMVGAYAGGNIAGHLPARGLMLGFAGLMIVAAFAMLRGRRAAATTVVDLPIGKVLAIGTVVGLVVGTVGAGGGFVVVPALVLLGGLAMESAVGTSLLVIAMQSTAGFLGHLQHVKLDWPLTLAVTAAAIVGSIAGGGLAGKVSPTSLRRGFGVFVLVMAAVVLAKELL